MVKMLHFLWSEVCAHTRNSGFPVLGVLVVSFCLLFFFKMPDLLILSAVSVLLFFLFTYSEFSVMEEWFFYDPISVSLVSVSVMVTCYCLMTSWGEKTILIIFSLIIVEVFFLSSKVLSMFVAFELSLVPMFILILGWGKSPERVQAGKFMLMYTFLASFPLLYSLIWVREFVSSSWFVSDFSTPPTLIGESIFPLFFVLAFLVKVPLFITHSWLPRAHVEAPLEGSMILASVMLKMGLFGLIRVYSFFPPSFWGGVSSLVFSFSIVGCVYAMILALSVDDLKMCVAYSSIGHMNISVASFMGGSMFSLSGCLISMVSHALVSCLLFMNVTAAYEWSHSRSVLINKGLFSKFPQVKFYSMVIWAANMSVPPFLSFLGEVKLLIGLYSSFFGLEIFLMISLFIIFGSIFSMIMFGLINHSGTKLAGKSESEMMLKFSILSTVSGICLFFLFFLL